VTQKYAAMKSKTDSNNVVKKVGGNKEPLAHKSKSLHGKLHCFQR
jgi:hypothetical protein